MIMKEYDLFDYDLQCSLNSKSGTNTVIKPYLERSHEHQKTFLYFKIELIKYHQFPQLMIN